MIQNHISYKCWYESVSYWYEFVSYWYEFVSIWYVLHIKRNIEKKRM